MNECSHKGCWHQRSWYDEKAGKLETICDKCGLEGSGPWMPDAYFQRAGQTFENLCDAMGNPVPIQSKRHKKEVMDKLGVSEAGDRINGAPLGTQSWVDGTREYRRKQFERDRPAIQETYKRYLANASAKR